MDSVVIVSRTEESRPLAPRKAARSVERSETLESYPSCTLQLERETIHDVMTPPASNAVEKRDRSSRPRILPLGTLFILSLTSRQTTLASSSIQTVIMDGGTPGCANSSVSKRSFDMEPNT